MSKIYIKTTDGFAEIEMPTFEAFKNNFEMTANLWIDKKLYANECQVLLRDDPNDASKVLDNQKSLVTYYYDGKWNRVVRKIVCEKLV